MTNQSRIDKGLWWGRAWSLVEGCTPVSPGCLHCWSAAQAHIRAGQRNAKIQARYGGLTDEQGRWTGKIRLMHGDLKKPLKVKKPTTWAVWNDLFHEDVPLYYQATVFDIMARTSRHTYYVLTKRPQNALKFFDWYRYPATSYKWPFPNVWLGVTLENQYTAHARRAHFEATPAAVKFVSYEPALGPIDWTGWEFVDQIISGGESGPDARPSHPNWHREARAFCQQNNIAYFMKQWGEWIADDLYAGQRTHKEAWGCLTCSGQWYPLTTTWNGHEFDPRNDYECTMIRVGKKQAGYLLDGQEWRELPHSAEHRRSISEGRRRAKAKTKESL